MDGLQPVGYADPVDEISCSFPFLRFLSRSMLAPSGGLSHGRLPPDTGLP